MILNALSDDQLITSTKNAVDIETTATTNVVRHFKEIFERDLYLARGFSSMYLMAVEEFGYDSSSAQRRTSALELALAVPCVLEKIDRGLLCLQSAADIQTFLNKERGKKKSYTSPQKIELVDFCSGLSTREIQIELASRNPEMGFKESKKFISKTRLRVTYTTSILIEEKLDRIKNLLSHVNPYMNHEELIDFMAERTLDAIDPVRRDERMKKRKDRAKKTAPTRTEAKTPDDKTVTDSLPAQGANLPIQFYEEIVSEVGEVQLVADFDSLEREAEIAVRSSNSSLTADRPAPARRYIPAEETRAARARNRDQGCAFISEETGRRCGSKHQEQLDHIVEFSQGGANDASNLRIYCAKHNRFQWRSRRSPYVREPSMDYA